jgi:hypothetical protein
VAVTLESVGADLSCPLFQPCHDTSQPRAHEPDTEQRAATKARNPTVAREPAPQELDCDAVEGPFHPSWRRMSDVPKLADLARPCTVVSLLGGMGGRPLIAVDDYSLPSEFKATIPAKLVAAGPIRGDKRCKGFLFRDTMGPVWACRGFVDTPDRSA